MIIQIIPLGAAGAEPPRRLPRHATLDINLIVTFSKGKVPLFPQWSSAQINIKLAPGRRLSGYSTKTPEAPSTVPAHYDRY